MNRFSKIVIVLLSAAVVILAAALLFQQGVAPASPEDPAGQTDGPAAQETDSPRETADDAPETADLRCSVQSGALRITRGETFAVTSGDESACQLSFDGGVYTVSAAGTGEAIVVTVPEDADLQAVTLTADGGDLSAEDLDAGTLTASCNQGSLRFSGSVDGDVDVDHAQGETALRLSGDETAFNCDVSYELGHVQIGSRSYAGARGSQTVDNGAGKTLTVRCAMGSVDVTFDPAA